MESYPVDIDPEQVVRWLKAECDADPLRFRTAASRSREQRKLPTGVKTHLGEDDREEVHEVATVATLDVAPAHAGEGWQLSVVVEDEIGPHTLTAGATGEEEPIDLDAFYGIFIRRGRGDATVSAEVENAEARARLNRLLHLIETNRHALST